VLIFIPQRVSNFALSITNIVFLHTNSNLGIVGVLVQRDADPFTVSNLLGEFWSAFVFECCWIHFVTSVSDEVLFALATGQPLPSVETCTVHFAAGDVNLPDRQVLHSVVDEGVAGVADLEVRVHLLRHATHQPQTVSANQHCFIVETFS